MRRPRLSVSAPWLLLSAPQASLCFAFVARPTGSLNRCLWSAHGSCSWPRCCARPTSLLRPQPSSLHRRFHPALSIRQPTPRGLATAPAGGFDASLRGTKANSDAGAGENQFNLEAEIKRLMSVPTIDIKLELQMRGVEHRDAFEKIDLAKRLAEARLRSPSATGGKRGNVFPSEVPRHVGEATGWAQGEGEAETRTASADDGSSNPSSSGRPRGWSATPKSASSSSRTAARENQQEEENAEKQVGEESEGEYHARCVSRAVRMGKPAIVRELNAMGIAHSRLSDVNVLARQYASAKVEARGEAQAREPDLFVADGGLVQRLEAARLRSLGRDELTARLRALKVDFSTRDSEIDLALLLQKAGGGDGVAVVTAGASKVSEEEGEKGSRDGDNDERWSGGSKRGWGWERWAWGKQRQRGGGVSSVLPWHDGRREGDDDDEDDEDDDSQGQEEGALEGQAEQSQKLSEYRNRGRRVDGRAGAEKQQSARVRDTAANYVYCADEASGQDLTPQTAKTQTIGGVSGGGSGGGMRVPLQARAGRMSSRELMNSLDSLGIAYPIPSARSELEEAFVSAVLAGQEDNRKELSRVGGRVGENDVMRLHPFSYPRDDGDEDGGGDEKYRPALFETYHGALRWARRLTFDDVLEELRFRGVKFEPNGEFSDLTRLLADQVLAEEELMEAESRKGYAEALEAAMRLSADDVCGQLREGGVEFDPAMSKSELASLLAGAKSRRPDMSRGDQAAPSATKTSASRRERKRQRRERRRSDSYSGVSRASGAFGFGDDFLDEPLSDGQEALMELESVARSIGGVAWGAVQETAAVFAGLASTLLPEAFPLAEEEDNEDDLSGENEVGSEDPRRRHAKTRTSQQRQRDRQVRMTRERANRLKTAASGFVQSSANRAGLTIARSAANGVLRGAEAAADWAGGGAVAREHVLLFIAAFCLVFKRGIGSSVALLVLIRAARISLQRLLGGGRATVTAAMGAERTRGASTTSAHPPRPAAAVAAVTGKSESEGRRGPTRDFTRSGQRAPPASKSNNRPPTRKKSSRESGKKAAQKSRKASGGVNGTAGTRAKQTTRRRRRRPNVDDLAGSDSDGGCTVM